MIKKRKKLILYLKKEYISVLNTQQTLKIRGGDPGLTTLKICEKPSGMRCSA